MVNGTRTPATGGDDPFAEFYASLIERGEAHNGTCEGGCDFRTTHLADLDDDLAGRWLIEEDCPHCNGCSMKRLPVEKEERRASWRVRGRRIATERSATYAEYQAHLRSDAWQTTRRLLIDHYGGCVLCGETERLHVHHRTYARVGVERFTDLTVLCAECHDHFHNAWGLED